MSGFDIGDPYGLGGLPQEALKPARLLGDQDVSRPSIPGGGGTELDFGSALADALREVQSLRQETKEKADAIARGEPVEIHDVMAAAEEAAISLELLVEIRNKLTDAYRTVMNMQV